MTVRELIVKLQNLNPTAVVVAARDSEGNGFYRLSERVEENLFIEDLRTVRETLYTPEQIASGIITDEFGELIDKSGLKECVVLVPTD